MLTFACSISFFKGQIFEYGCSSYIVHEPSRQQITTWNESLYLCLLDNSQLVSIEDENELNFLEEKLEPKRYSGIEYFIGLRKSSGKWTWISNNSIEVAPYRYPWATSNKPNGKDTHCAKMYFKHETHLVFDDIHCYGYREKYVGYICERHICCHNEKGKRGRITLQASWKIITFIPNNRKSKSLSLKEYIEIK